MVANFNDIIFMSIGLAFTIASFCTWMVFECVNCCIKNRRLRNNSMSDEWYDNLLALWLVIWFTSTIIIASIINETKLA